MEENPITNATNQLNQNKTHNSVCLLVKSEEYHTDNLLGRYIVYIRHFLIGYFYKIY